MGLHLYEEELEVHSHPISVSAAASGDSWWSHWELDWAHSVVSIQEGKDTILIPFPFYFMFFTSSVFYFIPDTNLCWQGSGGGRIW